MAVGTIFDIQRCSYRDGPGIRTTVFFKGCNLRCQWCHNPESFRMEPELWFHRPACSLCGRCESACSRHVHSVSGSEHVVRFNRCNACGKCLARCPSAAAIGLYGRTFEVQEVYDTVKRDRDFYDNSGGGITFSGGEPTMQPDFLTELAGLCHRKGLHTALETNGCIEEPILRTVIPNIDLILLDFKHYDPVLHKQYTGQDNAPVYRTLDVLSKLEKPVILRLPIIPTINDMPEHIKEIQRIRNMYPNILKTETMPYHNHGMIKWEKLGLTYRLRDILST